MNSIQFVVMYLSDKKKSKERIVQKKIEEHRIIHNHSNR